MKKLNSKGFGLVEGLLILVIVGIIGGIGYYVYSQNKDNPQLTNESTAPKQEVVEEYKPTTTVPSNWKTYTNEDYKISFAYPADWEVRFDVVKKNKPQENNDYSDNAKEIAMFSIRQKSDEQVRGIGIDAFVQPIEQSVEQMKKASSNSNKLSPDGHQESISSQSIIFNDKKAIKVTTDMGMISSYVFLVESNGYTFVLPTIQTAAESYIDAGQAGYTNKIKQQIVDSV